MMTTMSGDQLPKQFLSSLRILFDILDENRSGLIRLQDIESRWSDDGVRGLPPGVVDGLRKVTPPNGLLTFERFVAGLKLVLVKRKEDINANPDIIDSVGNKRKPLAPRENNNRFYNPTLMSGQENSVNSSHKPVSMTQQFQRFPQNHNEQGGNRPYLQNNNVRTNEQFGGGYNNYQHPPQGPDYSSQPPHGSQNRRDLNHRHHSESNQTGIPSPISHASSPTHFAKDTGNHGNNVNNYQHYSQPQQSQHPHQGIMGRNPPLYRPPSGTSHVEAPPALPPRSDRAPRVSLHQSRMRKSQSGPDLSSALQLSPPAVPPRQTSSRNILADLKNWQSSQQARAEQGQGSRLPGSASHDTAIYANLDELRPRVAPTHEPGGRNQYHQDSHQQLPQGGPSQRATVRRHGSGRRHTLSNGIDQNMLKRMKQLEEETSMLHTGLAMLDSARDWYKKQLAVVADKQAMLGKVTYNDNSVEAYQERMNFQRARIAEVNQHLKTLIESSERGFPLHMNLAMSSGLQRLTATQSSQQDQTVIKQMQSLQEQNRQLLAETNQRRDQIGQLEREKASLVRDLFEARAKNRSSHDDTTFM